MSKAKFNALKKKCEAKCGRDYLHDVIYHDGIFEVNLNIIACEDGDAWTVRTPNGGHESVVGISFPAFAESCGFAMIRPGVFKAHGRVKKAAKKTAADDLLEMDLPEPDQVATIKKEE